MTEMERWLGGLNALLGAWLIAVPFVFGIESDAGLWNHVIVGAAILVFSGYNAYSADEYESGSMWAAGLSALLGLWMIVAPFVFTVEGGTVFWNDVVVGALVALMAGYNMYQARRERETVTTEREMAQ